MQRRHSFRAVAISLAIAPPSFAASVTIGEASLQVPSPDGFVEVTSEFGPLFEYQKQFVAPQNRQFAIFIPEGDVPTALRGEIPELRRSFRLQVAEDLVEATINAAQFAELKAVLKTQNEEIYSEAKSQMPALFETVSRGISENLGTELRLSPGTVIPLAAHEDSERSFASSLYMSMSVDASSSPESTSTTISATTTFLHVKRKLVFLYCYGEASDLTWTREASRSWAAALLRLNPSALSSTGRAQEPVLATHLDLSNVLGKALAGALLAVIAVGLSYARKRLAGQETAQHLPHP